MWRVTDRLGLTLERLWQHRILAFWALVGLAAATTLAMSLWLYVDAVNTNLLSSYLGNPPYAWRFRYLGAWNGNITQQDVSTATAAIDNAFPNTLGLPAQQTVNYVRGGTWTIRRDTQNFGAFGLASLSGAEPQMKIIAGEWPPQPVIDGDPIPALLPEKILYQMGLKVGDTLTATFGGSKPLTLRIAALWTPADPNDPAWIFPTKFFDNIILIPEDALWRVVSSQAKPIDECAWYIIFDGRQVKTSDVDQILARDVDGERNVMAALPGIRLDASPVDNLKAFSAEVSQLTQQLIIIVLPVGGLVLYFVALVAGLLVSRQQSEDVTLRSRGMSRRGILSVHLLMWLVLIAIALGIAIAASPLVVRLVGQTSSFLRFDDLSRPLLVTFTPQAFSVAAVTGLIAAASALWMAWRSSAQTIMSIRQASARPGKPWWQRAYLDLLLLIPAAYILYTLTQQGGLVASAESPFSNPLTFVGPTLFSLGLTLLFLRLWPFLLRISAAIMAYGSGITLLMSLRELGRSIGHYRGTLLMMCFTLSLIGFTASMASTLDRSLQDIIDYRVGADAVIVTAVDAQVQQDSSGDGSYTLTGYNAPPIDDLRKVDGIAELSPAGRYQARLALNGRPIDGTVLGVDRSTIAAVTLTRSDYADAQMADLFNRLASNRAGIILDAKAAQDAHLIVGQQVTLEISALGQWYAMRVPILGLVNYFPTLDPSKGFFAIMNIQPIFETVGTALPYDIWASLKAGADPDAVLQQIRAIGFPVVKWLDPQSQLRAAQAAPSRRGVLGFLSIGFIASVALTLVGAVIQSAASFRSQALQLGTLRAMGLGGLSVGAYLMLTQGMAAVSGVLSGTGIGLATTLLFLPLLDFSGGLPPYLVRVDWNDTILVYSVFAGVLLVVTLFASVAMGRERLASVVKLGDA